MAGKLNSQRYFSEVLEHVVLPYIQYLPSAIFQQGNVVACDVQVFFSAHQIELLPWPACYPDLSPIETVWSMLAQRLARDIPLAATSDQFWQYAGPLFRLGIRAMCVKNWRAKNEKKLKIQ
ncbi:transposable element Tcb1 transposase [Trichonephila clavipes]|nr:transposable element Tcb1 transposase [Trichonephila clavipes]